MVNYIPHIIIAFLGVLSTVLGILLTHQLARKRELEIKLYDNRRTLYLKLLQPFINALKSVTLKREPELGAEITAKMIETSINLSLFASDNVIYASNHFRRKAIAAQKSEKQDPRSVMNDFAKIILEIRKDSGNPKTKLIEKDVLQGFISEIL